MDHRSPDHGQSALCDHPVALPPTASQQQAPQPGRPDRTATEASAADPETTSSAGSPRWWDTAKCRSGSRERGPGVYPGPRSAPALVCALRLPEPKRCERLAGTASPPSAATSLGQPVREPDRSPAPTRVNLSVRRTLCRLLGSLPTGGGTCDRYNFRLHTPCPSWSRGRRCHPLRRIQCS
jgi:hypothetical protein